MKKLSDEELAKRWRKRSAESIKKQFIKHNYTDYEGGKKWSSLEEDLLFRPDLKRWEIAKRLHRSLASIKKRRYYIKILHLDVAEPFKKKPASEFIAHVRQKNLEWLSRHPNYEKEYQKEYRRKKKKVKEVIDRKKEME